MELQLLSEDVLYQILSRLPAKSLIRFKCVSKSWNYLFKDRKFIQENTIFNMINPNLDHHLLVSCRDNSTNKRVISMSSDSSLTNFIIIINKKKKELINNYGQMRLIGSCNGIVCLYGFHQQIALCNPTIGDFKILPFSNIPSPIDSKVRGGDVGLGYDSNTDDYKVIHIIFCIISARSADAAAHHNNNKLVYQVEIYSLNTNSWTKYDSSRVPSSIMNTNMWSMVYKNKTFCWWAKNDDLNMEVILSFDMEKHVFQETPLPNYDHIEEIGGEKRTTRAIMPWKEQIGLVVYHIKEVHKFFDLWVLVSELGDVAASWIKVSRIGGILGVERPLGFWKNGEMVILESSSRELVLYDPKSKEITNLGIYGKRDRLELLVYIPSLVCVNR